MFENQSIKHIHCIGVGGIGVSALAEMLLQKGYRVTGSDISSNLHTKRLIGLGVPVFLGHAPENIHGADLVVYSSAITEANPERSAALELGIPLLSRGELLAWLMRSYSSIAVSGTHGKTTTTSLVAHILLQSQFDPSFAIGGVLNDGVSPVRAGGSPYFVAEADESDASFLFMMPTVAVVTNIDADHLESYGNDFASLKKAFLRFLSQLPEEGVAIVCVDDPVVRELLPEIGVRVITYGFSADADIQARDFKQLGFSAHFSVSKAQSPVSLNLPGRHNVLNALAAIAVSQHLGVDEALWQQALKKFPGVGRRFQSHGEIVLKSGRALVIEDYGHHPSEVAVTLSAARSVWPNRRLVLVFQPHRYSRTHHLWDDFIRVLSEPDQLLLTDVYSAGEAPISGVDSFHLSRAIEGQNVNKPILVSDLEALPALLLDLAEDGDVIIFQGAGSIGSVASKIGNQ